MFRPGFVPASNHAQLPQWKDTWTRVLPALTLWICVSVILRYGYYGNCSMVLGPSSSRLMKASSVFVQQVQVRDENWKGALVYVFSEKPELSNEVNWNFSNYLIVGAYDRKGYSLWLNKGSRICIRWATQPSRLDKIELIIIKGEKKRETLLPEQTVPFGALFLNEPVTGKEAEYNIEEDDKYSIGLINSNPRSIIITFSLNVTSKVYDVTKASDMCSTLNGSCRLQLQFPHTQYVIVSTPDNGDIAPVFGGFWAFFILLSGSLVASYDGPLYDFTAYTECKAQPEEPLYQGGILKGEPPIMRPAIIGETATGFYTPAFLLKNLTLGNFYCFSTWIKIQGANSALIRASLKTENRTYNCIGTVLAKNGCWSFLKGGFVLDSPSNLALLLFQNSDDKDIDITIDSSSLQPFTDQEWRFNQQFMINNQRKRAVTIHVSDQQGNRLQGAAITINQVSKDFPFGSAIAHTILGNLPYQNWFVERFNAAVFENELKWYATEPDQGKTNYTLADQMLEFVRAHQIIARGHNIFWEDPKYTPAWVRNLTGPDLQSAVNSRIQSLMSKYKEEFIHWDVSNEMLHFDFYEQRLGPDATLHFYETAHQSDPLATLFMNEFNVVETCSDVKSTVDTYIERIRELERGGMYMDGIGLESHFTVPNLPLMRAVIDKLATLRLPIWLTEVDISSSVGKELQGVYLEEVLREGFSHPSVNGIMLWTALHPKGCYEMCLTDENFKNLPAGDVVDKLLKEWESGEMKGVTDEHGSYSFYGFLGEYKVNVGYGDRAANSTFSLPRSDETKHFSIHL